MQAKLEISFGCCYIGNLGYHFPSSSCLQYRSFVKLYQVAVCLLFVSMFSHFFCILIFRWFCFSNFAFLENKACFWILLQHCSIYWKENSFTVMNLNLSMYKHVSVQRLCLVFLKYCGNLFVQIVKGDLFGYIFPFLNSSFFFFFFSGQLL